MPTETARAALVLLALAAPAVAEAPMSAIDWLSKSVSEAAPPPETGVAEGASPVDVAVTVLGAPAPDAVGVLTPEAAGLPAALWGLGTTADIAAALAEEPAEALPALRALMVGLLLAALDPPSDARGEGRLLLARVDKLLAIGAVEPAEALIEAARAQGAAPEAELFRRAFDVAMLTGTEDRACAAMRAAPDLSPTFPARVFCLARAGDWNAAALSLRTGQALGQITAEEDALLSRFLDPELAEDEPPLPAPQPVTPLAWRMFEAIGESLPTNGLPLAFAHADLRDTAGWRGQIEAAERLARAGALSPERLASVYLARLPAASGGVWDRVEAFQRFQTALDARDPGAVAANLPRVWARMTEGELEEPFARLFAEPLQRLPLTEDAAAVALRMLLLARPDTLSSARAPADATEAFLIGIARGDLAGVTPPDSLARAIAPAFLRPEPGAALQRLIDEDRRGEAVIAAMAAVARGTLGDLRGVTEGLSALRAAGLDPWARRVALELMILERRG
ncbi:MAG TPA: hypothetical protein PKC84_12635 [Paracoccaceae bacterium]|nr:hypothetical protein [Paracoccaceae bacterium]